MNVINWIYIIDSSGATILSFENQIQGTGVSTSALLSHFLFALQSIAKTLQNNEIRSVEMSNNRFFLCKENMTNYLFIIKTNRDADTRVITPVLNEIKNKFLEKFKGHFRLDIEDKIALLNAFKEEIKNIVNEKTNIEKFVDTL
ncbi:MAG: hypothetical protein ACFFHV_07595 [Promethearchaeota archaeon]